MDEHSHRVWVEIDLAALERNLGRIRAALPPHIQYMAVVKADAYGHGLAQMVARLMQSGADAFCVASVYEGAEVREIGAGWPILVLSSILPEEEKYLLDYDLIATVSSADEVERFDKLGQKHNRQIPVHMKIDTGMGRMGVWHEAAEALLKKLLAAKHLDFRGIFTHFSSADSDREFTEQQRRLFLKCVHTIPDLDQRKLLVHADNSAGLESFSPDSPFNAVRVGLLQFGIMPYADSLLAKLRPEPVLSFHSRVGLVKKLPKGTGISYKRTFTLERDSKVAIMTAGYGDGIPTAASNRGAVLIGGKRCPILGRVTMDQTVIDVTDVDTVQAGDKVTLIGEQLGKKVSVAEFCNWSKTIPWEIFCSITKRVRRVYKTSRIQ